MNSKELENQTRIDAYLMGHMNASEKTEFEKDLKKDSVLKNQLDETRMIIGGLKYVKRKDLIQKMKATHKNTKPLASVGKTRSIWILAAASIVLIIISTITFQYLNTSFTPDDIYAAHYEPYPNVIAPVVRSTDEIDVDELEQKKKKALELYENGEFSEALQIMAELDNSMNEYWLTFYRASALMALSEFQNAIALFQPLSESDNAFKDQSTWYLGLCYLKLEDLKKAEIQFKKISNNDVYGQKAQRIIKALD